MPPVLFKSTFLPFRYIHTYIFINPRSHVTIQDPKTVSDEIEKEAKKTKLNYLQQRNIYIALQFCLMDGKALAWKSVTDSALTAELGRPFPKGDNNKWDKGKLICIGASKDMSELMRMVRAIASMS